jgi:hypothetical protein
MTNNELLTLSGEKPCPDSVGGLYRIFPEGNIQCLRPASSYGSLPKTSSAQLISARVRSLSRIFSFTAVNLEICEARLDFLPLSCSPGRRKEAPTVQGVPIRSNHKLTSGKMLLWSQEMRIQEGQIGTQRNLGSCIPMVHRTDSLGKFCAAGFIYIPDINPGVAGDSF